MMSFSTIFDLHDSSTIIAISMVNHMLNSAIRKCNSIFPFHVSSLITGSLFTEVCAIFVIMYTILKVERIGVLIISTMTCMTTMTNMTNNTIWSRMAQYMCSK